MAKRAPDYAELNMAARQVRARQVAQRSCSDEQDLLGLLAQLDTVDPVASDVSVGHSPTELPSGERPVSPYGQVVERSTTELAEDHTAPASNTGAIAPYADILSMYFGGNF